MTEGIPEWYEIPNVPLHEGRGQSGITRPFTAQQLFEIGARLIDQFLKEVVKAIIGFVTLDSPAFDQLRQWAEDIQADVANIPILGDLVEVFTGIEDGDLNDLGTWVNNLLKYFEGLAEGQSILQSLEGILTQVIQGFLSWIQSLFNPLGFGTTPTEFTAWLNNLPSWSDLVAQLTGIPFGDLNDLQAWADQINRNQREFWNRIVEAMDFDHDGDVDLQDVITALTQIPSTIVTGTGGPATNTDTFQQFWDGLWGAFTGLFESGKSMSDVNSVAGAIASSVANHEATLGVRDNRPVLAGLDATAESSIDLNAITGYFPINSDFLPMAFIRTRAKTVYGKVSWLGYNTTGFTGIYIDIFKVYTGPTIVGAKTGDLFFVARSPNLISEVSDALAWNTWDFDALNAEPGDVWGIRILLIGAGTYYIAATDLGSFPLNPAATPRGVATRTFAVDGNTTHIDVDTISWINTPAFYVLTSGDIGYHTPVLSEFTTTSAYTIPEWVQYIDVIACPGGGGGRSSDPFGGDGEGGHAGNWGTATLQRGVHFHTDATSMTVLVGDGGTGGTYSPGSNPGGAGGVSGVQYLNTSSVLTNTLNPSGGAGGTGIGPFQDFTGGSPGYIDYAGRRFYGGAAQSNSGYGGNPAGGGGAGGHNFGVQPGGAGAPGVVWLNARQS